jgi:hypothetical protein
VSIGGPGSDAARGVARSENDEKNLRAGSGQPIGQRSLNDVAFAIQQPFPDLVRRADLAVLVDVQVQPGVRYRPSAKWQWDLYANLIEGGGGENDHLLETPDFAGAILVRPT